MGSSIPHAMYDVESNWNGGIISRFKDILSRCTFFHQPQVSIFILSIPSLQTGCRASRQCRQNSEACSLASLVHLASRGPAISHPRCLSPLSLVRIRLNMTGNNFEHIIELLWCETPKDRSVQEAREGGSRENN